MRETREVRGAREMRKGKSKVDNKKRGEMNKNRKAKCLTNIKLL
jgi:hypothetical protein